MTVCNDDAISGPQQNKQPELKEDAIIWPAKRFPDYSQNFPFFQKSRPSRAEDKFRQITLGRHTEDVDTICRDNSWQNMPIIQCVRLGMVSRLPARIQANAILRGSAWD